MITVEMEPWMADGLCAQTDPELFFPEVGVGRQSTRAAKRVCAECPVREECLQYAVTNVEMHGVWGGMTPHERGQVQAGVG